MKKLIIILLSIFYITLCAQATKCKELNEAIIQENQVKFKNILLENIDINCKSQDGRSPLGTASAYGNKQFVSLLLQKRADPNIIQFNNGKSVGTPLFDALSICAQQLEPKLIDPVKINFKKTQTKKFVCSNKVKDEITKILIDNGADILAADEDGTNTLMMASMYGRSNIIKLLIDKGVNINARNNYGNSALIYAVSKNDYPSVNILILAGADASIKNNEGKTVLDIAKENHFEKIISLLSHK